MRTVRRKSSKKTENAVEASKEPKDKTPKTHRRSDGQVELIRPQSQASVTSGESGQKSQNTATDKDGKEFDSMRINRNLRRYIRAVEQEVQEQWHKEVAKYMEDLERERARAAPISVSWGGKSTDAPKPIPHTDPPATNKKSALATATGSGASDAKHTSQDFHPTQKASAETEPEDLQSTTAILNQPGTGSRRKMPSSQSNE